MAGQFLTGDRPAASSISINVGVCQKMDCALGDQHLASVILAILKGESVATDLANTGTRLLVPPSG